MNARAKELFHDVADLTPDKRARYFAEHEVDEDTCREVEELLAFDSGASAFLMRDISIAASLSLPQLEPNGWRCGPYRLLHVIGRGGMGAVYLAERADGEVSQRLAVKLLPPGAGDAQRERFLQERQILASLAHPNIARMLDAGHVENGQPFLAMEYVEGKPIDVFAAELSLRQKITLFLKVSAAVGYLHRNLVVHRDLKPSNILVTADGEPKLLDFGIAKMLGVATDTTMTGMRMLTPDYASPEQVAGGTVSTATDIYSLGAVLYYLLTGKPAHEFKEHTPEAVASVVATREVTRPSRWTPELKGDLDSILLKALRKDPGERYATAEQFSEDLESFLKSRPVKARSGNTWYSTRKLLRRYWVAFALAALAFFAAAGGIVATTIQARTIRKQRDFAFRELARSEAILNLNDYLLSEVPTDVLHRIMGIAEQMVRRSRGNDVNRVDLLILIADNTPLENGAGEARRIYEDAYHLSRSLRDPSARARAACALGGVLARGTEFARAEALVQEGLRELSSEPEFMLDRSYCLLRGAYVSRASNNGKEAIARIQAAQKLLKEAPFQSELDQLRAVMDLGDAYRVEGQNREACAAFEETATRLATLGRDEHGLAGSVYYRWSRALSALGRPLEAEPLARWAMGIFGSGVEDESLPPFYLVYYARLVRDLGRLEEAAHRAERAYARARQAGEERVVTDALLLRLSIYRMQGEFERAREMISEVEPRLRGLPPGNINFASLRSEQSLMAQARSDRQTALDFSNQALAIAETSAKAGQQGADLVPILLVRRSDIEREIQQPAEAAADARRALALVQQAAQPGTFSSTIGQAFLALGRALQAQGQLELARDALRHAAEHFTHALGSDHPDTRIARELAKAAAIQ
jgi:serine/threonine-protein kinase